MDENKKKVLKRELTVFLIFLLFGIAPFIAITFQFFGLSLSWNMNIGVLSMLVVVLYLVYLAIDLAAWFIRKMIRAIRKKSATAV